MLDQVASLDAVGEEDRYTVTLTAGVKYYLEIECGGIRDNGQPGFGVLTLADSYLYLYDPASGITPIRFDDDGGVGFDSQLVFTPTVSGDYQIGVQGYNPDQLGTYRVKAFEDDYTGSREGGFQSAISGGTHGTVLCGGSTSGIINYVGEGGNNNGDVDVFAFKAVGGLRYTLEVRGAATGDGTLLRPELRVLDFGERVVKAAFSDVAGSNVHLSFNAGRSSTFYAAVEDWHIEQGGTYVLALSFGRGSSAGDNVRGSGKADGIDALAGNDSVLGGDGDDTILGGQGDDILDGGLGDDILTSGSGRDRLTGGLGNDRLAGGAGGDGLAGGSGDDLIEGGGGRDFLQGGADADRFVFGAGEAVGGKADVIGTSPSAIAFERGFDVIDLSGIDADETAAGDQAFVFDGTTGVGHIWLLTLNGRTVVRGDTDGTGRLDLVLVISDDAVDHSAYDPTDFVL